MKLTRPACIALALFLLARPSFAQQPTYSFMPQRPAKAGDVMDARWVVDRTSTLTMTPPGGPAMAPKEDKVAGDLSGHTQIKEVFPDGEPKVLLVTVKSFKDSANQELVAPGKILEITRDAKDPTTVAIQGGGDLDPAALAIVQEALPTHYDGPGDNDVFGSKTPRAVGEKWPIDAAKAAEQAAHSEVTIKAADVSGDMTIKSSEKVNGVQALRVEGAMNAKNVRPSNLPEGFAITDSDMKAKLSGVFPTDPAAQPLEMSAEAEIHFSGSVNGASLDMVMHTKVVQTFTPAAK